MATSGLKPVIDRTIDGSPALPSGHTGGTTSPALVARDAHHATDTVAGFCTAVAVVATVALVVDRFADAVGTRPADPPARTVST